MEPPSKVVDFLPSAPAKWTLWVSLTLSGSLYALLLWLQIDTLLPKEVAQKLSILLPPLALLLLGAFVILFFVVRAYNKQHEQLEGVKREIIKSISSHVPVKLEAVLPVSPSIKPRGLLDP